MATETTVILTDSLDPRIKTDVQSYNFYDPETGRKLEIELSPQNKKHFASLMEKLSKYVNVAQIVEAAPNKPKVASKHDENVKIREWAKLNGYTIGDRGRIKAEIIDAYRKAQDAIADPNTDAQAAGDEPVSEPETPTTEDFIADAADQSETNALIDEATFAPDNSPAEVDYSDAEILELMAEIEKEHGEVTESDLKAALDASVESK